MAHVSGGILSTTHNRAEAIQIETSDDMSHRPSPAKRLKKQDTEGPTWYVDFILVVIVTKINPHGMLIFCGNWN